MSEGEILASAAALLEVFWRHRSVRHFRPDPIPPAHLDQILAAAQRASTDATAQMYTLIRITDPQVRDKVARLSGDQQHIRECAEFFVVCLDVYRLRRLVEYRGGTFGMGKRLALLFGTVDAALAAENLALAAEALGYGICFIGGVQNAADVLSRELALPEGVAPVCGLCVGVPDPNRVPRQPRPRLPRDLVVHENGYRDYTAEDLARAYEAMAPIAGGDWYAVLRRYFTAGGVMETREAVVARAWRQQDLDPDPT